MSIVMNLLPRWAAVVCLLTVGCERLRRGGANADAGSRPAPQVVALETADGAWSLGATRVNGEVPGCAVVLVHQLGSHRGEWAPLVARLQRTPAVSTLALDLRGHGASVRGPQRARVHWSALGTDPEAWANTAADVDAALRFLALGGVHRVVLVGAGLGATAAILAASRSTQVEAVAMISPGLAYQGIAIEAPFGTFLAEPAGPRRVLLLGGASDEAAAEAVPVLARRAGARGLAMVFGGERHRGAALLNAEPARWDRVETFVRAALGATRTAPAVGDAGRR